MPRSLRSNCPNTFYHVFSRGVDRRAIFKDQIDYDKFLDLLGNMVSRFDLEVHAFVVLANHYHLLLRTRDPNLSEAMQWFGSTYATWFNKRHQRIAHLFQGRFKSFVIENDRYLITACLSIHRNPIRAGIVRHFSAYPMEQLFFFLRHEEKDLVVDHVCFLRDV